MSKKFGLIVLVLLAFFLSACEINASAVPTATPKKNKPQASATPAMNIVEAAASQTALASGVLPVDPNATPVLVIVDATVTATPDGALPQPTLDPGLPAPTGNVPAPQPTVQTAKPETYVLKEGEFIFCLARRFNVDPDQTLALNGLWDSETIYAGLTVKIPVGSSFPGTRALKAHPATYVVQSGDSIYSIACKYGDVDPMNIAAVNGLAAPYTLTVGAQLQIP